MHGSVRWRAGCPHNRLGRLTVAVLIIFQVCCAGLAQDRNQAGSDTTNNDVPAWTFSFSTLGYIVRHDTSYASPVFAADHHWLHLEARYNYEDQRTGSLWAGYNLSTGKSLVLDATPMLGAVFGSTNGIAPGGRLSLSYKTFALSSEIEYVFDSADKSASFLYSWNELVYSPTEWFHTGLVSQRTRAYHTALDVQRGFLVGFSHQRIDVTAYVLNAGWTDPTVVLGVGFSF